MKHSRILALGGVVGAAIAAFALAPIVSPAATPPRAAPKAAPGAGPTVIELFQSQGCSSCPPALAVFEQEARRGDVLALNFAVTYWDRLGWKDTFARSEFTQRQYDYASGGGREGVFTPQLIVNGRTSLVGGRKPEVDRAIAAAGRLTGPAITRAGTVLRIGARPSPSAADVWLVDYDPRLVAVPIRAGENGGRTIGHRNIVTAIRSLGQWRGSAISFRLSEAPAGRRQAVLVQRPGGGVLLAAAKI